MCIINFKLALQVFFVDPCKPKRQTSHAKGQDLDLPRRKGSVKVEYISNARKRLQCLSARKFGFFKKAYELNTMTGKYVKAQVGEEYWCPKKKSLNVDECTFNLGSDNNDAIPAAHGSGAPATSTAAATSSCTASANQDNPALSPQHFQVFEVTSNTVGIQCNLADSVANLVTANSPEQCRYCGGMFQNDSKHTQDLWVGCDKDQCDYWVHAFCLLGKSNKITAKFVKNLPFKCPFHK
ncbi:uncharacterized protein LOC123548434 [Mercenaria mercenaria]|uniref:uncharacterized protein LOC123548434 n=1 Tax=Mercenaria mercenaria TaxID=6596 RepID=UPI00234F5761|nr:uncharacterized protein LOC123548434 [Mercenaria mercenaria]